MQDVQRNTAILCVLGVVEARVLTGGRVADRIEGRTTTGRKAYRLREAHPWTAPLRMLLERAIGTVSVVEQGIGRLDGIRIAFIYGSYATASQRLDSDIDLVVIGDHSLMTLAEPVSQIEQDIGRSINVKAYTPKEWRDRFKRQDHFVQSLAEAPKVFIIGDAAALEELTHAL